MTNHLSAWFLQLVDNLPRRIPDFPVPLSSQSGNFTSCSFIYQLYRTTFSHLILVSSSSSLLPHILLHLLFRIFILTFQGGKGAAAADSKEAATAKSSQISQMEPKCPVSETDKRQDCLKRNMYKVLKSFTIAR